MVFPRAWWVIVVGIYCCGCAAVRGDASARTVYEEGYRAGVKEQMEAIVRRFEGNDFPYFHWAEPIVQDVEIPAHIDQGVFIPQHRELVLIKPGEWRRSGSAPILSEENETHDKQNPDPSNVSDLTVLP